MKAKRPMLVTIIVDLNLLSVFIMIVSLFPTPKFIQQFGICFTPINSFLEGIIRILTVIVLLLISYGFFKLKRWAYDTMVAFNLFFLVISIIFILTKSNYLTNVGNNFIQSLLGLMIIFPAKRYFIKENKPAQDSYSQNK